MAGKSSFSMALCLLFLCNLATNALCNITIATNASLGSYSFSSSNKGNKRELSCRGRESQALLKFKNALNDSNSFPINDSWVGDDCCSWNGVVCDSQTGHVVKLDLSDFFNFDIYWVGEIDPSLLELKRLNYLDLSLNYFGKKPIPKFFGSFKTLRHLDLSYTDFVGIVPHQLGNISALYSLNLQGNKGLKVDNLQWLSHLSSLHYLNMKLVDLSMATDWLQAVSMIPSLSELRLPSCGLTSALPATTLHHLNFTSHLTVLDLSNNSISSFKSLTSFGSLCNLLELDVSSNALTGEVKGFLNTLTGCGTNNDLKKHGSSASLRVLDLSDNSFSGTVPESLGQLTNLVHLRMANNSFEGVITEAHFANLTRLESLSMSENSNIVLNITPHWIPPFRLQNIRCRSCKVGPQFPTWLQFMMNDSSSLELDLSLSQISDVVPNWFWNLFSHFSYVNISHNQIYGKIPSSLISHPYALIDFSSNLLEGSLPQDVSNASLLDLSNNLFTGSINVTNGNLLYISLSNNLLHGSIPSSMTNGNLVYISLSNNLLHGSIPSSICGNAFLSILDLSENNLTGQMPLCFRDIPYLTILDLSYNNLDGVIPNNFTSTLSWLQLRHNNLSGVFPSFIGPALICLDLSENKLLGPIPTWIGESLSKLIILNLRSNMFHGNIPPQLSLLPSLQILDLANNRLSGNIPGSFGNFSSMTQRRLDSLSILNLIWNLSLSEYGAFVIVAMKGTDMKYYTKTLFLVTTIDLSRNKLSGEIPQGLTRLNRLQSLNLSRNHLEGMIPKDIGSLRQLMSLDLSLNHLSGSIPSSISMLNFLISLNLSNNSLSGRIPSGNQLQTLMDPSSIYFGNDDLCGPPLTKLCPGEAVPPAVPNSFFSEDERDTSAHWWFYVGLAPGFVVGFWLVCGILILNKSWRIAYYRFFDRLNERLNGFYINVVIMARKKMKWRE